MFNVRFKNCTLNNISFSTNDRTNLHFEDSKLTDVSILYSDIVEIKIGIRILNNVNFSGNSFNSLQKMLYLAHLFILSNFT